MGEDAKVRKMEMNVLERVGEVISVIKTAKHVDQVICAIHSVAVLLFPIDSSLLADIVDHCYREQVLRAKVPSQIERVRWWNAYFKGAAFSTLSRVLLLDVASNWLACFPFSARKHVYDVFFLSGFATEVVQTLVPFLQHGGRDGLDVNAIRSNAERLLLLCFFENDGVVQVAREFKVSCQSKDCITDSFKSSVSRVAQIIASIPDKAQTKAPTSLSSHVLFKRIATQLLYLAEESDTDVIYGDKTFYDGGNDITLIFVGEIFSRICRRGSTDILVNEIIPRILKHVQNVLSSNFESTGFDVFESNLGSQFWLKLMETVRDDYAVERMSEQLLFQLATSCVNDVEAYWILWLLFHRILEQRVLVRSMFIDKFLLWKVFPICCLRWLLQFAVLKCPTNANCLKKGNDTRGLLDTVQRLVAVWSKKDFVQSATLEQQAYLSAAVGLSLELMSKDELDETKNVMHSILQGVSNRLESPNDMIRKMASNVALVFSKVIDPKNPLYLDDSCTGEPIDWELGLNIPTKGTVATTSSTRNHIEEVEASITSVPEKHVDFKAKDGKGKSVKTTNKKVSEVNLVDPDEIIDPATLDGDFFSENDDDDSAGEDSDSTASSLQPYDLSDDDTDLKRKFTQLVDVVGALRKSDDADGVERALDVAEKLVRASPDELKHVARDLVRTLVQVRCSDLAVEGEEESAEDKRQRALVALLVTCPVESLDTLNKLLYSPNVDTSQRIMILDVMTDAALELANSKTMKPKYQTRPLIATTSETQPWFLPSTKGPPGAGSWKEISTPGTLLNWSNSYERELPLRSGHIKRGKTRRWSLKSSNREDNQIEWSHNKFPVYAAAFMLPAMQGFDKKRQGVDLLDRDFIVLGKLIYMLGICMKCAAMHPEASALAPPFLDMLRSREVYQHKEAYVRQAVLFAASCILMALHPSYVASSLLEGNLAIAEGLEWVRSLAIDVAESDPDRECSTMAMTCLQLHAEMALQASRALESASADRTISAKGVSFPSNLSNATIKIPFSDVKF